MDKENIAVLDLPKLSKEVAEATEIKDIFLLETCGFPVNEKVILEIPDNHMYVKARFYPPSKGGSNTFIKPVFSANLKESALPVRNA